MRYGTEILDVNFTSANYNKKPFEITTDDEKKYYSKSVIIATGADTRDSLISFSKPVDGLKWKPLNPNTSVATLNLVAPNKDSLLIWVNDSTVDSLKLQLLANAIPFDTVEISLMKNQSKGRAEKYHVVSGWIWQPHRCLCRWLHRVSDVDSARGLRTHLEPDRASRQTP